MLHWFFHTETTDPYTTNYYTLYIASILWRLHAKSVDPRPRQGRAGRTRPGLCFRLCTRKRFEEGLEESLGMSLVGLVSFGHGISQLTGCLGAFWDILDGYINHHWIITDRFPERCQILNRRHQPMWILQDEVPPELTRMPLVPCPFRNRLEDFGGSFEAALDQSGLVASTLLLKLPLSDTKSQMTSDHWILIHPSQRHEVSWYT